MKPSLSMKISLPLLLALGTTLVYSPEVNAQDREERRVLRASEVSREQVSAEYRKLAREKRRQEMQFAEDLLRRGHLEGDRSAEMMLRLADLYFQEGRDIYMTEMETYEAEFDACFNNPNCDTEGMEPNNDRSKKWQQKSIRLYKRILQQFPNFRRADEATFYLATALQDTGKREKGIEYYKTLVRSYPDSGFVPDSFVQIGEYYFDENNAYRALQAYRKAAKFRDSDKFGFDLYKLAWCYYNVAEYGKAIDTMKRVVALEGSQEQNQQRRSGIQLSEEALKDLVRFFADAGDMDAPTGRLGDDGDPVDQAGDATRQVLVEAVHVGLDGVGQGWSTRLTRRAGALDDVGLKVAARLGAQLAEAPRTDAGRCALWCAAMTRLELAAELALEAAAASRSRPAHASPPRRPRRTASAHIQAPVRQTRRGFRFSRRRGMPRTW